MKILLLGAGLQGSACAYDLLRQDDVEKVTVADIRPDALADFVPRDDARLDLRELDFGSREAVATLAVAHDVLLSAAPWYFNGGLARTAVEAGCHYSDLGGNTEILRRQLDLAGEAEEAGVCLLPDIGLAPGMVDVLAAEGIRRLDQARRVRMYVGGLPQRPEPPLNYQLVYSLEGTLDYYTTRSWIIREGRAVEVEALSEVEELEFREVGRLEAFHTAGGASLLPWDFEGEVRELSYKTLRYPGHARIMEAIRALGLLSEDPVEVRAARGEGRAEGGPVRVIPRDVFIACARPALSSDSPDLVALRVVVEGPRDGRERRLEWNLLDRKDPATGISAMERTTGFSLSVCGLFLGRGVVERRGAFPAYEGLPYGPYVEELDRRGVSIRFSERGLEPHGV